MFRPVFGCSLDDHLRVNDREIAFVIEECVLHLLENGLDVEVLSFFVTPVSPLMVNTEDSHLFSSVILFAGGGGGIAWNVRYF